MRHHDARSSSAVNSAARSLSSRPFRGLLSSAHAFLVHAVDLREALAAGRQRTSKKKPFLWHCTQSQRSQAARKSARGTISKRTQEEMASYAEDTPVQADRAKRTLAFASATSSEAPTPAGPPLSPYRDPSANCDPSEAPTPVRERRRESPPPDEPENAEEESLRLALELQEREERYAREQEEGAARHAELSQRRREEASSDGEDDEGDRSAWKPCLRLLDGV